MEVFIKQKTHAQNTNESEDIFIQIKNEDFDFDATVFFVS